MGWFQYYRLLEQYSGDLSKATKEEMNWAAKGNPNDPHSARALAEKKYREEQQRQASDDSIGDGVAGADPYGDNHQPLPDEMDF